MELLLTILSVLAGWSLLIALALGLLFIMKALQSVRSSMERISMGVRAIEQQSAPLGARVSKVAGSLQSTNSAIATLADTLSR